MPALSYAAAMALAIRCGIGEPPVPPDMVVGLALGESGLQPHIVSPQNTNGTHDNGFGQINDSTLELVGLTKETAQDPCQNMAGMARYLRILSSYHKGPHGAFDRVYVERAIDGIRLVKNALSPQKPAIAQPKVTLASQFAQFSSK